MFEFTAASPGTGSERKQCLSLKVRSPRSESQVQASVGPAPAPRRSDCRPSGARDEPLFVAAALTFLVFGVSLQQQELCWVSAVGAAPRAVLGR